jgi:hypothetical protein
MNSHEKPTQKNELEKQQCDQIGRNFAIWAKFLALGAFFSEKYCPNDLGVIFFQISPKIHLNKL